MHNGKPGTQSRTKALGIIIRSDEQTLLEILQELQRYPRAKVVFSRLSTSKMLIQEVPWGVTEMPEVRTEPAEAQDDETDKDERQGAWSNRGRRS